jgi:antitoxin PrlF
MGALSAKVTAKGQITLPAKLRAELGIKPGDRVDFHRNDAGKIEMTAKTKSIMDLKGIIKTDIVLTTEELVEAANNALGARWHRYVSGDGPRRK